VLEFSLEDFVFFKQLAVTNPALEQPFTPPAP
jgi:hypothetical protein